MFDNETTPKSILLTSKASSDSLGARKVKIHSDICNTLNDLYERKNNDYGDVFTLLRNEYPNAILYRLFDKYHRLKTLKEGATQKVKDESIKDTLMDMANYCILELIEMTLEEERNNER